MTALKAFRVCAALLFLALSCAGGQKMLTVTPVEKAEREFLVLAQSSKLPDTITAEGSFEAFRGILGVDGLFRVEKLSDSIQMTFTDPAGAPLGEVTISPERIVTPPAFSMEEGLMHTLLALFTGDSLLLGRLGSSLSRATEENGSSTYVFEVEGGTVEIEAKAGRAVIIRATGATMRMWEPFNGESPFPSRIEYRAGSTLLLMKTKKVTTTGAGD